MFKLNEADLEIAKQIAFKNRKKKSCDVCYDRGWVGVNQENLVILCHKCVDMEKALEDWKNFVNEKPELKEHFKELFEEEEKTENE